MTISPSGHVAGRTAIWFFRVIGPTLLASLVVEQFVVTPGNSAYEFIAGPLYLLAWVGAFLVFLDCRKRQPKFALPFLLVVLTILVLAVTSLAPMLPIALPTETQLYGQSAARALQGLAALAFTAIGWTSRVQPRTRPSRS